MTIPVFTVQRMLQTVTTAAAGLLITSVTMVRYLLVTRVIHILRDQGGWAAKILLTYFLF